MYSQSMTNLFIPKGAGRCDCSQIYWWKSNGVTGKPDTIFFII